MGGERDLTVRDGVVAAVATVLMSIRVVPGSQVLLPSVGTAIASGLAVVSGVAFLWRRQRPWLIGFTAVTASGLTAVFAGPILPFAGWLGIIVLTRYIPTLGAATRAAAFAAVAVVAGTGLGAVLHSNASALPLVGLLTVVVTLAAIVARLQSMRAEATRRQLAAEREQAVVAERLRIARDLHDLVGHGLATIAVQSGSARLALAAGDAGGARRALSAVEEASRQALAEMRHVLGVLRPDGTESAPVPSLDRIDELVHHARAAGHSVTLNQVEVPAVVPTVAGLTAYRVVQEALTNTRRHAPGATVAITIRMVDDCLMVEVIDDGTGDDTAYLDQPRYGLLGLRERVQLAGGTLDAGPRTDAPGWRVAARLPIGDRGTP